ncbi:hypothetical protein FWH13_02120 [Candidatus Saccharibacteria bacterium]|nr:hypothetical protein [Candidatus Saccharibacteria bacterium]
MNMLAWSNPTMDRFFEILYYGGFEETFWFCIWFALILSFLISPVFVVFHLRNKPEEVNDV